MRVTGMKQGDVCLCLWVFEKKWDSERLCAAA